MEKQVPAQAKRLCVLRFGSSVLRQEADFAGVALEVYRHVREGAKVVAVVSALAGETDALLAQAERLAGEAPQPTVARLVRIGELHSAASLALALSRIGVRARMMDPHEMGFVAEGEPLDADPVALDTDAVRSVLDTRDVLVVPGFSAGHSEHGVATLGRGGADLSAVFLAARLGADRTRLIEDVDGVYAEDPARNPEAERFEQLSYANAAEAGAALIQPKAIRAAEAAEVPIEVAALGAAEATTIGSLPARRARAVKPEPLRVALLGCGSVGAGVLEYLNARPDLFELNPVLVRNPRLRGENATFTSKIEEALAGNPDLIVELMGGAEGPAHIMRSALRDGIEVVTANKAAVARHYDALHACAEAGGVALRYSAAVGGGAPILETLGRLKGKVAAIEGVMNGTCNFLLSKLGEGWGFDEAVAKAQEMGFAEANPSADVDGHDAADKLSILVREAFGIAFPPEQMAKQSLREITPEAARDALVRGEVLKQVGRCTILTDGSVEAAVRIESLPAAHPLAAARNEENRFLVRDAAGMEHDVFGKGAGRWPTAAAVFADVMDAQRALTGRRSAQRQVTNTPLLRRA